MRPHGGFLMRSDAQGGTRFRGAGQDKAFRLVLRVERIRIALIDYARQEFPRAGKAAALTADERQRDPAALGGAQHIFIFAAFDRAGSLRCLENDAKTPVHYGL